jgi:hypothetical protein
MINDRLNLISNFGIVFGLLFVGLEYQNNSTLVELESRSNAGAQVNDVIDVVLADPTLVELMGKNKSDLTTAESDRLRLLGIRMLLTLNNNYLDAVDRGIGNLESHAQVQRAIYYRPRLNYGLPDAWETYRERVDSSFVGWFEANVIAKPPSD